MRIVKVLGIAAVAGAILAVGIGAAALAAPRNGDCDQIRARDGSGVNCTTNQNLYDHDYQWLSPGPHGPAAR